MPGKFILETDRLLLREFDEGDAEAFLALGSDPAILRYVGHPGGGLTSLEQALEEMRARPMADYQKHGFGRWACVHKADGKVIGFVGLKRLDDLGGEVDLGYRFLPACWGMGLATEASRPTIEYGFTRVGLRRIIGLVDPANTTSVRVLQKLGLTFADFIEYHKMRAARYVIEAAGSVWSAGIHPRFRMVSPEARAPPNIPKRG